MNIRMTRLLGVLAAGGAIVATAPANATTAPGSLGVSADVADTCVLTTSPIAFGTVDVTSGANTDATGGIAVTCTNGTAWSASADAGLGSGATLSLRKMTSGSDLLDYALYTDTGHSSVWGDGVGGTTALISDTGTGTSQSKTIYGRVPSGQTSVPVGNYADTVAVTVTY
jgi:spore coat protein U-like protein